MSAPNRDAIYSQVAPLLCRDVNELVAGIRDPLNCALVECQKHTLDVVVNETYRRADVQVLYYSIGRDSETYETVDPPTVTNARTSERSWHGYRTAFDLAHRTQGDNVRHQWWCMVAEILHDYGFAWGGHWLHPDLPHFQPAVLPASPTPTDIADFRAGNLGNVWTRYQLGCEI